MYKYCNFNLLCKDRKLLFIILSILLALILLLTIVYAALSTTLNINGIADVMSASWDIYLDNVVLNSNSATSNIPTITDQTTATFSTTLSNPGDFYEFTIDVVNNGSIDAMIDSVTKTPELSGTQKKYLNYIVEYQNGESITTKQLVTKKSFVRLKVKVEFRKDLVVSDLPATSETLNLSFKVNYIQSDDSNENVLIDNNGKLIKIVSGNYDTVGSEICIGEECFYVISSNDNSVTILAKYNLYVGGMYDGTVWTPYGDEATGIQDSTMLGWVEGESIRHGTTVFSSLEQKGINYNDYNGSIVEEYVNNYSLYLESQGIIPIEARLITRDELIKLGCNTNCQSSPKWVYGTSYWTESNYDVNYVWRVTSFASFDCNNYHNGNFFGVRPVITISKFKI